VTSKVKLLLLHLTSHRLTLALTATQMQKMQLHLMHQPTDGIIYDTLILTILHYITLHHKHISVVHKGVHPYQCDVCGKKLRKPQQP